MNAALDRRAVVGAMLAGSVCLSSPSRAALPSPRNGRVAAAAQRIAALLREREANHTALRVASARFKPPKTPAPTVVYRGPFGPINVDVDPAWIRELLPDFSPRSRRGRRLRKLLRLYEEHYACMCADREASGVGPFVGEQKRIEQELKAAAKEACCLEDSGAAHVALQAASLLAVKLGSFYEYEEAPAVVWALLKVAGGVQTRGEEEEDV